jgi:hypothetical protein
MSRSSETFALIRREAFFSYLSDFPFKLEKPSNFLSTSSPPDVLANFSAKLNLSGYMHLLLILNLK